ncbi:unnamed protein product [Linum tenue]|uniref:TFIIS N-terminal domain-containing protein n=1 Tax=Linum tenue TaxID=586396 RepID=A0AAV0M253_9ROSI|nr:unnamed protein product [Linum tenue]
MKPGTVDYWRDYFRAANSDIFEIIDHAIMVAAADCPKEFRQRRDRIAERLFSCRLAQCSGCNRVELAVPPPEGDQVIPNKIREDGGGGSDGNAVEEEEDDDEEIDILGDFDEEEEGGGSNKESKVNSSTDNGDQLVSNYSYGEAEALTDELEEQSQVFAEVQRIKSLLLNHRDEAESTLFDSLRRLQLMALSVDTLKATEIGKAVNSLRKHGSKDIRQLARTLIDLWKDLVDEWYSASKTIGTTTVRNEGGTPDSMNPSVVDEEEGLPSPPMDEGIFFATQATGMELGQFFDGMDDDGNPREMNKNRGNGRRPSSHDPRSMPKPRPTSNNVVKGQEAAATLKQNKPSSNNSGPGRPPRQNLEPKSNTTNSVTLQRKTDKIVTSQRKPLSGQQQQQTRLKCSDEVSVQMKLEATKRKLQESYQQVENAKRQRTIQVMELHDLPKQGGMAANRNPNMRHGGNGNRNWANGRR